MADDRTNRGPEDGRFISLKQPHEVAYWTKALGVSKDELKAVVALVGNSTAAVRDFLEDQKEDVAGQEASGQDNGAHADTMNPDDDGA